MPRPRKPTASARFQIGAKVRVKSGVRGPDFSDIPLGGWAGTVKEVEQAEAKTTYLIAWDRATLRGMHPIYKKRCDSDGLSLAVHRLPDPTEYDLDDEEGLLCEARDREGPFDVPLSEVDDAVGNRKLVRDYGYWFWNWR